MEQRPTERGSLTEMREQLLGYLLGALEPSEQAAVEARLADDPEMRRELEKLRHSLCPLDDAAEDEEQELDPPPGLAARTFQFVRSHAGWTAADKGRGSSWRAPDYAVAAGIFIAASMMVFPAINNSRAGARLTVCQNKLGQLGLALAQYSEAHGCLPFVPATGNLAASGAYAPILQQAGLISSPSAVVCPESPLAKNRDYKIPTVPELQAAKGQTLHQMHLIIGGSYGYHPGHIENGRYVPTRYSRRDNFAVMADASDEASANGSSNHGHRGQNVLLLSGRVVFVVIPRLIADGDHFYVNDFGTKGAGSSENDSSISNSAVAPIMIPVKFDH